MHVMRGVPFPVGYGSGGESMSRTMAVQTDPEPILIVDDEPAVRRLIARALSDQGFRCHVAADARAARQRLESQPYKLLIADIALPGSSGLELLTHTRVRFPRCKVILITGVSNRAYLARALTLGAYDYLEKPIDLEELAASARRAIRDDEHATRLPVRAAEAMQLLSRARQTTLEIVQALVRAVEAKDPYTRRHSEQVAHYATHIARMLGAPDALVERARVASLLHDVGKIGVPDFILTKPGPLTVEEFEYVRRHPVIGAEIVSSVALFEEEARLIRHHHERWDGKGYPDALAGEEIPLGSRIIMVADSVDAMLMTRSYKPGYPVEQVLEELQAGSGTQFAPQVATAAVQWCRENPDELVLPNRPAPRPAV